VTVPHPIAAHLDGRRLVLASGSPRRRELLGLLGLAFDVLPPDVDETPLDGELPLAMVERLAAEKARAVIDRVAARTVVVAADTTVDIDGETVGKPDDEADAARILRRLAGRTHQVHTAVAVAAGEALCFGSTTSDVTFAPMTDTEIGWYVATGEPLDKAGAYGMQGIGGIFVAAVVGSVTGVLGLPLDVLIRLLADA
jgi:septum formation protein